MNILFIFYTKIIIYKRIVTSYDAVISILQSRENRSLLYNSQPSMTLQGGNEGGKNQIQHVFCFHES